MLKTNTLKRAVMKKTTLQSRMSVLLFLLVSMQHSQLSAKNELTNVAIPTSENTTIIQHPEKQDKNLLKGIWQRTDAAGELTISEIQDNGFLNATYYNPKGITIEKAVWLNSSDVLRIYILFREDKYPGSSFSLNYMIEKDMLLGTYFDALTNESYTVSFKRVN
jgi:hypothetical protein